MENYSLTVHRSLMKKRTFFGIGRAAFLIIMGFTGILASITNFFAFFVGTLLVLICRALCKDEPFLIDFVFETLKQQGYYNG